MRSFIEIFLPLISVSVQINVWNIFGRLTIISKKEIFYFFPFGLGAWLCNVQYIDRRNVKSCYDTLQKLCSKIVNDRLRVFIYPEGTRNHEHGLLPFKRGAFSTAIQAQVPIVPMVVAPYYFMDPKQGVMLFDRSKSKLLAITSPTSFSVRHLLPSCGHFQ